MSWNLCVLQLWDLSGKCSEQRVEARLHLFVAGKSTVVLGIEYLFSMDMWIGALTGRQTRDVAARETNT